MDNIIMKEDFKNKKLKFNKDNFHVISDFDKTLTKAFRNGKNYLSTFAVIRDEKYLSKDYPEKAYLLFDKYHPFEVNESLDIKEKSEKMQEWWNTHWDLMVKSGMNKEVIKDIIENKFIEVRDGFEEFLDILNKNNIPLLIFSAGIGNLIEELLKDRGKLTNNVHIISNFFEFGEDGKAKGHNKHMIHVFNKHEVEIKNYPYYKEVKKKDNVILIGDSIGDLGMAEGLKHDNILNIGYLNENDKLNLYKDLFDVLILNDGSLEFVNSLLKEIVEKNDK